MTLVFWILNKSIKYFHAFCGSFFFSFFFLLLYWVSLINAPFYCVWSLFCHSILTFYTISLKMCLKKNILPGECFYSLSLFGHFPFGACSMCVILTLHLLLQLDTSLYSCHGNGLLSDLSISFRIGFVIFFSKVRYFCIMIDYNITVIL